MQEKIFSVQQMRKMLLLAMLLTGLATGFITHQLTKNSAQEQYAQLLLEKEKKHAEAEKKFNTPYRATIGDEKDLLKDALDTMRHRKSKTQEEQNNQSSAP